MALYVKVGKLIVLISNVVVASNDLFAILLRGAVRKDLWKKIVILPQPANLAPRVRIGQFGTEC